MKISRKQSKDRPKPKTLVQLIVAKMLPETTTSRKRRRLCSITRPLIWGSKLRQRSPTMINITFRP